METFKPEDLKIAPRELLDAVGKNGSWDVTAVVPAIPPRVVNGHLDRALRSVATQTYPVAAVSVAVDIHREGAPATRQRALDGVTTPWVAFLDDDDEWLPEHVGKLVKHARRTRADVVYSWYHVVTSWKYALLMASRMAAKTGSITPWFDEVREATSTREPVVLNWDPVFPESHFTEPFDPAKPIEITSIVLARTDLAKRIGFEALPGREGVNTGEDYRFVTEAVRHGARIEHLVERTWLWHHDSEPQNTSGRPENW